MNFFSPPSIVPDKTRYELLDMLRGIAALSIVIWHYRHFYLINGINEPSGTFYLQMPLFDYLTIFYQGKIKAVELFWVISGFVFASLYAVSKKSWYKFILNRFSRLYPLHFVTLLVVLILQIVALYATGHYLIYENNDLYHVLLNLLFIPSWGFEVGLSYNGPVWSVSIEILVYIFFYLSSHFILKKGILYPLLLVLFFGISMFFLSEFVNQKVFQCGLFFYSGVLVNVIYRNLSLKAASIMATGSLLAGLALFQYMQYTSDTQLLTKIVLSCLLISFVLLVVFFEKKVLIKFKHQLSSSFYRALIVLGDASYGMYLIHVPIQLILILIMYFFQIEAYQNSVWFFGCYMSLVIYISVLSCHKFEKPMMRYIRNKYL